MSKHVFGTAGLTFQATNKGIVPALQSSKVNFGRVYQVPNIFMFQL
jgi:hypothetical protein